MHCENHIVNATEVCIHIVAGCTYQAKAMHILYKTTVFYYRAVARLIEGCVTKVYGKSSCTRIKQQPL